MTVVTILLGALGLAAASYVLLERLGRRAWLPTALRTIAYSVVGILLVNTSCQRAPELLRPLVLLDGSLSMAAAGGRWDEARTRAAQLGEVRVVGPLGTDSSPSGGRSEVAPAVLAAAATGRPVWLVTDGEVDDAVELPPDVLARVGVETLERAGGTDLALTRVDLPDRLAVGDTLRLEVEERAAATTWPPGPRSGSRSAPGHSGSRARCRSGVGSGTAQFEKPLQGVGAGDHLVEISLVDPQDQEPTTDLRYAIVAVTPTPGIVVVASPGSWESRFLYRTIEDVAALPVRGYVSFGTNTWRRLGDLASVTLPEVQEAASRADVLAIFGDPPESIRRARVRGRWDWVATSDRAAPVAGDWYLRAGAASPVAGAFIGLPVDSFPPALAVATLAPDPGDWVALFGQADRRGVERPAVVGRDSAGRRAVIVGAAGLWRWAFRGGASEQAYRGLVAGTLSWLLGGTDTVSGRARPDRPWPSEAVRSCSPGTGQAKRRWRFASAPIRARSSTPSVSTAGVGPSSRSRWGPTGTGSPAAGPAWWRSSRTASSSCGGRCG
ncbi:MAG: hypothetical protein R2909_04560 [Gemmatimonadales bacterium]